MENVNQIQSPAQTMIGAEKPGQRLRIVHCLFTFETGGAQVLTVELLNEMSKTHDVSLVIINNQVNPALIRQLKKGIQVHYLNRKEGNPNPWPLVRLNLLLMKLKPDVIHCHEPKVAKAIRIKNPKLVYTIHDVGIDTKYYHLYDSLIAISAAVYNDVKEAFPEVRKIDNGIPVHLFQRRQDYKLTEAEPFRMVQLSRLMHEKKGQDVLLKALYLLSAQQNIHSFTLDFVGSGSSEQYLRDMVKEFGLEGKVNFLGERNREWLYENLCGYHTLLQPSRYEGFGLTILEGFAAGLPVIASDIDGPAEIVRQTPAGFLFRDGEPQECANAIAMLIEKYKNNQISVSMKETLKVVNDKYSVQNCSKEYLNEYTRLIKV